MKKTSLAFFILSTTICISNVAKAQTDTTYKAFKVDFDFGLGAAIVATFEPHYRLSDKSALGLRLQGALTGSFFNPDAYTSVCFTGDYYFNRGKKEGSVLLLAGAGLGVFTENQTVTTFGYNTGMYQSSTSDMNNTNFGAFIRFGIETGHFRTTIEDNYTGGTDNYACLNIGFFFGGGKK